jgi:hypothetical protein
MKIKVGLLLAAHGFWWLGAIWLADDLQHSLIANLACLAMVSSQICLLAIWGGLGTRPWPLRLVAVAIGVAGVWAMSVTTAGSWGNAHGTRITGFMALGAALAVSGSLWSLRRWWARLERLDTGFAGTPTEGLQFKVLHLLLLTALVAASLGAGEAVRAFRRQPCPWQSLADCLIFAVMVLCAASLGLATLWACLGLGSPLVRIPIVLCLAVIVGLLPPFYMDADWERYRNWAALMALQTLIVAGSLLVFRSCGYRLVKVRSEARAGKH